MKCLQVALICFASTGLAAQAVDSARSGVKPPTALQRVEPQYTPEAKRAHIEGTVGLRAVVGADGSVRDVAVVRSLDTLLGLDQQAVNAMKQWRFKPALKDGKPVQAEVDTEMRFVMKQ